MSEGGYEKPVLVTTDWLAEHAGADNIVVAEVDENTDLYEEGHVPGAVKLHWRDDLQDSVKRDIVAKEEFERLLGERGIGNDTTVVLYGDKNNWFAAYAYWYLKIYGHEDVRILDGGRQKWIDEGRELTTDVPSPATATYTAQERDESIAATRCSRVSDARAALSSTSAARRSTQAICSRRPATSRRAHPAAATSRRLSPCHGRRPCATTARSSRPTSCARSTAAKAFRPRRT